MNALTDGISVIVCTHNGSHVLPETLRHLARQSVSADLSWEIIVVDNASTDDAGSKATVLWEQYTRCTAAFRVLTESKPAKYHALQAGIAHAQYNYFIICDDDNWLQSDYVETAFRLLNGYPKAGAIGGKGIATVEGDLPLPSWYLENPESYAVGPQGKHPGDVSKRGRLWGAGLASRTNVYRRMYQNYPTFLPEGDLSKEDTEYCLRLILWGYELRYDDRLIYQHFIPKERLLSEHAAFIDQKNQMNYGIIDAYYMAAKLYRKRPFRIVDTLRLVLVMPFRLVFAGHRTRSRAKYFLSFFAPFPNGIVAKIKAFRNARNI